MVVVEGGRFVAEDAVVKFGGTMKEGDVDSVRSRWWEASGSLHASLLRLDGQVGTVVNAEKHLADSATVSGELAQYLGRLAQQMGFGTGDGVADHAGAAPGFEPVKPGFTREAGSIRQQVSGR